MQLIPWIILLALLAVYSIALPILLKRAGQSPTLGYIPLVNFYPFLKLINRPWWWLFLILCPGVNLLVLIIMNVELGIVFGKRKTSEQWMFGALPWYSIPQLAFKDTAAYIGPRDWKANKKTAAREWGEAIVFAVIAASVIRTFFIEAFTIPTPSMEKSMLVGDYLFVSKVSYGAKIPQTPVAIPFVHNAIPGTLADSYVSWFSLPYYRLPGIGDVERYDPVVFNFPHGDTIIVNPELSSHDFYRFERNEALALAGNNLDEFQNNREKYMHMAHLNFAEKKKLTSAPRLPFDGLKARPMDKRDNYVKRCIGLPGETIEVKDRQVYINGSAIENPKEMMHSYDFILKEPKYSATLYEKYKINKDDRKYYNQRDSLNRTIFLSSFTQTEYEELKKNPNVIAIRPVSDSLPNEPMQIFPNSLMFPYRNWSQDNMGPVFIPAKGSSIQLTAENVEMYRRVITNYEGNTLREENGKVFINGQETNTYTFQQDYYWMMGDNRHNSADSRFWGFVPEDHIVGKPVFTWYSRADPNYQEDTSVRWGRMFRLVK